MIQKLKDVAVYVGPFDWVLPVFEWSRSIPKKEVYTSQLIGKMITNQLK